MLAMIKRHRSYFCWKYSFSWGDVFDFFCGKSLKRLGIQVPDHGDMLPDFCCADMKASGDGADVSEGDIVQVILYNLFHDRRSFSEEIKLP